jgi:carbonic anhydrase/acetyltransferase-like protein (isoleucine patch superfamily)
MPLVLPVHDLPPRFGKDCFLAPNATVVGDVVTGDQCSFWFNAVVRGDVNSIKMGNKVNVQDNAVIHCTYETAPTVIGNEVSIGHNGIVHGCTIHDRVLVGMGAIVMDHAVVESDCLIAAGAVVLENSHLESGYVYAGVPAKRVKALTPEVFRHNIERIANNYVKYAGWFRP